MELYCNSNPLINFVCASVCGVQNCVTQIFDTREVSVTQNATLAEEFATNIRLFFLTIDQKIGESFFSLLFHTHTHLCYLLHYRDSRTVWDYGKLIWLGA